MSNYNPNQSTRVFSVTPAPSGQNTSKEIWEGFLNEDIDEINIVNERTNTLIGTIGGIKDYKFSRLPKSYFSKHPANPDLLGEMKDLAIGVNDYPTIRLNNGNIGYCNFVSNYFNNGIIIFDFEDLQTLDANKGWWVAFKISDSDPNLLEKVAELKQTDYYWNNGWQQSLTPQGIDNVCKYIDYSYPFTDNEVLFSEVTTLTITQVGNSYTLSSTQTSYDFGGTTTINLYNDNAPSPVLPGAASWNYRYPYFSMQNDNSAMMDGRDAGWIWYGNGNDLDSLFTYQAGFNVLTGETAIVEPISALAATTNFNPLGVIDGSYFSSSRLFESHPAGVWYAVRNRQPLDNGNNNNDVTALFSPRWVNNTKVTFLNQRNPFNGNFMNIFAELLTGDTTRLNSPTKTLFDNENFYSFGLYSDNIFVKGTTQYISRFKLDSDVKEQEIDFVPLTTNGSNGNTLFENENGIIIAFRDITPIVEANPAAFAEWLTYIYWQKTKEKSNQLQSNNAGFMYSIIGNKFVSSIYTNLFYNAIQFGIQYDAYDAIS